MALLIAALLTAAALAGASAPVAAEPAWHHEDIERTGRIADLDGRLRLQRASGESVELGDGPRARQWPIREGDRLHTGWNSRLVLDIGPNRVKLDERSTLRIRRLEPDGVALELDRGSVVLELRQDHQAWRWQVDTAVGRHQPHGAGQFRIDAPDRQGPDVGSATAWRSALRIENEDGALLLPPGRRAERDRSGRWQVGFPQADAFSAWAMANPDREPPPDDWHDRPERPPRQWQAGPSWEVLPPPPPPPPRVVVVPAPIVVEPPPRHWRAPAPEHRDPRPPRWAGTAPIAPPVPPREIAPPPPRPDRRHHEVAPLPTPAPVMPPPAASTPGEPRRSQRML